MQYRIDAPACDGIAQRRFGILVEMHQLDHDDVPDGIQRDDKTKEQRDAGRERRKRSSPAAQTEYAAIQRIKKRGERGRQNHGDDENSDDRKKKQRSDHEETENGIPADRRG